MFAGPSLYLLTMGGITRINGNEIYKNAEHGSQPEELLILNLST